MTAQTLEEATENIYTSLAADNDDIDLHITALKDIMNAQGVKEAEFEANRLAQNNRAGRKMMQSYFKKRGVKVVFS